jgi:TP901 family phage tail tape measure protein
VSNTTEKQMEKVRVKALQLGQDTRYSAGEIADSFVELGKAGVNAQDIIDGVGQAVANLGAAADIPLVKAAQIITSAVQTFELSAKDAVHVSDLLAGAANASIVEIEDLGVSLKYVGGVAASIKIPIGDVIDGLALLGKYGIRGSTAGTSLRQILVSLSGTSKKASGELKKLGIITKDGTNLFFNAKGQAKPLSEIFQILQDKTKGLTDAQRLAAFKIIFNNRALAAASVLTREGAKGFSKMNKEIAKTTAADVAAKRMDNLAGDIEILRGNIETFFIKAGTPFQEFLRKVVQGLTQLTQWFGNLDPEVQKNIFQFLAIAGAVLTFLGVVAKIISVVIRFINVVRQVWQALVFVFNIVRSVAGVFGLIAGGLTPLGWIVIAVMAIVAVFTLLWNKSEAFRNFFIALWQKIVAGVKAALAWFQTLPGWFSSVWNSIKNAFVSGWNAVMNFFTVTIPGWFTTMKDAVVNTVMTWYNNTVAWFQSLPGVIGTAVGNGVNAVVAWFAQLPSRAGYWIGFLIGRTIRYFIDGFVAVNTAVNNGINAVIAWFVLLPGRISAYCQQLWAQIVAWFQRTVASMSANSAAAYQAVVTWFQQLPGRISAFFSNMYARVVTWMVNTANTARAKAQAAYQGVVTWFQQLPGRVAAFVSDMYNKAKAKWDQMVATAKTIASNIYNGIVDGLNKIPGAVSDAVGNAIQAFKDMVNRAFNAAKDFAAGLWNGFKEGLGINSPSFIEKQMVQITDVVGQETRALRSQVRAVQSLGSRLTKVSSMAPTDQTLTSAYAGSMVTAMADQEAKLRALRDQLAKTAQASTPIISDKTAAALSASSLRTAATIDAQNTTDPTNKKLVMLEGTVGIDQNSQAWVRGIAVEVVDDNADYNATVGRM